MLMLYVAEGVPYFGNGQNPAWLPTYSSDLVIVGFCIGSLMAEPFLGFIYSGNHHNTSRPVQVEH